MIVLDTNVASEVLRQRPNPTVLAWLDQNPDTTITTITAHELLYGGARMAPGARRETLTAGIASLLNDAGNRILGFDLAAARHSAALIARREADGRTMSFPDACIAGICLATGLTLATRNAKDFTDTGVALINPWDA